MSKIRALDSAGNEATLEQGGLPHRVAECDCVPCIVSSKSCHKCGRKGVKYEDTLGKQSETPP